MSNQPPIPASAPQDPRKIAESIIMPTAPPQFVDLVQRADAYILALRQCIYSSRRDVIERAQARLNELGSCWYAARESCASDIPENL